MQLRRRNVTQEPEIEEALVEVEATEAEAEAAALIYDPSTYDPDLLPPYEIYEPSDYRDGPEGFIKWCEDKVWIPIYPEGSDIVVWTRISELGTGTHPKTGKTYDHIWQMQKAEFRKCLRMVNGQFVYRLIIFSWMRGEGKSLVACLIQLWKFFNWPKQQIVLGANSKDQVKFVHFDVMKDIIRNSPELLEIIGERNIQEKEVRLRDAAGNISSVFRALSSFSGIVSNITGYTFSEMFDMKNPKFFTQLDGSTRNVPNALGVIDSTVSPKTHVLYKMYLSYIHRKTKTLYFSYRYSKDALIKDYWNPNMDQQQLDDYREKFPLGDFEKYFMNIWGSDADKIFTPAMMEAMNYIGVQGRLAPWDSLREIIEQKVKIENSISEMISKGAPHAFEYEASEIRRLKNSLWPIDAIYKLKDGYGQGQCATIEDLSALSDLYDTNWAILIGVDRADPLKSDRTAARTIVTVTAKGLAGSRSNILMADDGNPKYLYIRLNLVHVSDSKLEGIKDVILEAHTTYDGVDTICGERWGLWDMKDWCVDNEISFEPIHPSYGIQKAAFSELYGALSTGRFKSPPIAVWGSKEEDIFKEEAVMFIHDTDKRWFGSPEKDEKYGVQDDSMFAEAWGMHGGRDKRVEHFRERGNTMYFGSMVRNRSLLSDKIDVRK